MYLKSIEIQGFKSFANKILFEFHNGITGIVGPNGSGKSNVADAVRWVLGEQSAKQLRGSNMQDVIFSGTENRKPLGFASVAITLDNTDRKLRVDYSEVTVSRKVFRSGESEYRMNGTSCRLRDIQELFYDTGIGKEGYSIIGQGQIEQILSSKPEGRRELFDEAAGIVLFKHRKAEAQKRLDNEDANMVRLQDIMTELEKQVGPLARQSEAAKEYLRLRDELKGCEVTAFVLEHEEGSQQLKELSDRQEIVSGDYEDTKRENDALNEQYEAVNQEQQQLEEQLRVLQEQISRQSVEKEALEGGMAVLREQIHTEQVNQEHYRTRMEALARELLTRKQEEQEAQEKRTALSRDIYDAQSARDRAKQQLSEAERAISRCREQMASGQGTRIDLLNEKSVKLAEVQKYQTMLEQAKLQRAQLAQKLIQSHSEEETQEGLAAEQKQAWEREKEKLEQARSSLKATEETLASCRQELLPLQQKRGQAQQKQQVLLTRAESLRNMAERYEGYGNSIRRVMEQKQRVPGIQGVVADLIHVKKNYETAVETALGGSIQNIVTDSEQTAKRLIAYLKSNKYGRATFLPMDGVRGRAENSSAVAREPGVIGLASSLVETEEQYRGILEHLLGRIWVVDTIDHALAVAAKYHRSLRIVTLDGELLSPGGAMTGGAFRNASNLLGRNRELEEIEEQITKGKSLIASSLQREKLLQQKQEQLEKKLEQEKQGVQTLALLETEGRMRFTALQRRKEEIVEAREETENENRLLEHQLQELRLQKKQAEELLKELEERGSRSEESIHEQEEVLSEASRSRDQYASEYEEKNLLCTSLDQQEQFLMQNLERISADRERFCEEEKALEEQITASLKAAEELQKEIADRENKRHNQEQAIEQDRLLLAEQTERKNREAQRLGTFFAKREELSERLRLLDKDLFRLNSQKERLEERLDERTEYLLTEYEMQPSEAVELSKTLPSGELPQLTSAIAQLKQKIRALGTVNVNAIEEFKEVSERYTFMKTQYEDLLEARQALLDVIEELDTGMRAQFTEKFAQIREEFDQVFRELFGGGKGTLELVEGEDVIEAGIRIISQPPGKKLQNMMQLSGGEKALTAIALLFAIQNLKPSPFCLLDEIEAALDDSNVGRFSGYLHKLTANTQFIVITHRRGTMTAADRLYGITMQEKGVSTLDSVNLIENDLDQ